ncbi:MAG: DVUA0089 family protein, partial [Phycisphaeraceae bacterium]|nr:DVUA0089 family protein [Phycisphaeraceae bacterium]
MRKNWKFTAIGLFLAAGTAQAQVWNETANGGGDAGEFPGTAQTVIGSGTLSQITGNHATGDVDMYRINICNAAGFIADVAGTWDSQLYVFALDGRGLLFVDDRAANLAAYLDNASGAIAANGEYYLAVSGWPKRAVNAAAQQIWNATPYFPAQVPNGPGAADPVLVGWTGSPGAGGNYTVNLTGACYIAPVVPVPPSIGATVAGLLEPTRQVTFTATVSPGFNPASTSYTVTADLSTFGGSSSVAMYDNGTNGDPVANDLQYTLVYTIPGTTTPGAYAPQFNVTDQVPRSNSSVLNLTVAAKSWNELVDGGGDAGELPGTAQTPAGSGTLARISGAFDVAADADMYRVEICDFANFSATTAGNTTVDTQLFLFRDTGTGVMHNDDNGTPQSTIDNSGGLLTGNGNFYLAVTAYNRDPVDSSNALLWANTPFTGIRAPDGPAASNAVAAWTGTGGTGAYAIDLTGVCHYNPATPTPPSIVGNITGLIAGNIESGRTILLTGTVTAGT